MNLQQMKEARKNMDRAASNSAYYKAQKDAHDKIEQMEIEKDIATSDEDYFNKLLSEVA